MVFRPAIGLRVPALPAEAADFSDRHTVQTDADERLFDGVQFMVANNRFNFLHANNFPGANRESIPKRQSEPTLDQPFNKIILLPPNVARHPSRHPTKKG